MMRNFSLIAIFFLHKPKALVDDIIDQSTKLSSSWSVLWNQWKSTQNANNDKDTQLYNDSPNHKNLV